MYANNNYVGKREREKGRESENRFEGKNISRVREPFFSKRGCHELTPIRVSGRERFLKMSKSECLNFFRTAKTKKPKGK